MANNIDFEEISTGTVPNDGTGTKGNAGGVIINENFDIVKTLVNASTTLTINAQGGLDAPTGGGSGPTADDLAGDGLKAENNKLLAKASAGIKVSSEGISADIAIISEIQAGTVNKLVDSAGLVRYMSDRHAILYPNGGTEASPANITVNQVYRMNNPFAGHHVQCTLEVFLNNYWGDPHLMSFLASSGSPANRAYGAMATRRISGAQDYIVVVTGNMGILYGYSVMSGDPFELADSTVRTTLPARVHVTRLD